MIILDKNNCLQQNFQTDGKNFCQQYGTTRQKRKKVQSLLGNQFRNKNFQQNNMMTLGDVQQGKIIIICALD